MVKNKKKGELEISPNIQRGFSASTLTVSRITVYVICSGKPGSVFCSCCKLLFIQGSAILVGFDSMNGTIANTRIYSFNRSLVEANWV